MSSSIFNNQVRTNPDLRYLLDLLKKEVMLSINCHHLSTVESFDSDEQTVTATINYSKTYFKKDDSTLAIQSYEVPYPILTDVPVIILGGGNASLTFPIQKGDQCLILFNDRDMDNWVAGARSGPVNTTRLHSFADGIALVGLNSISSYDSSRAVLANGTTLVGVSASKVKVANAGTTLNTLLQSLVTTIQAITTTNCVVGSPVTLSPASIAALSAVASQIGGLLE